MVNEVAIQEKEIEKKERLAQTYILIFGLLLASNQNENIQQFLVAIFFFFLISIVPYYTFLTNIKNPMTNKTKNLSNLINLLAMFASLSFGLAIVAYTSSIVINMLYSITIPLLNFLISTFTSDFGNHSITVETHSTTVSSSLLIIIISFLLPQCCLLTIITAYSLVIIPRELKDDDPIQEIVTMIKMIKNLK